MEPIVYIVDDDQDVREALAALVESNGFQVKASESADAFLATYVPSTPGCLVTDLRMPGMSGAELQATLKSRGESLPVILVSGHADIPTAVELMKAGASDLLEKPPSPEHLLQAIRKALALDAATRTKADASREVRTKLETLTPRESEVLAELIKGKSSKAIGAALGISVNTVEVHRTRIMKKMQTESSVELVRICLEAGFFAEPRSA